MPTITLYILFSFFCLIIFRVFFLCICFCFLSFLIFLFYSNNYITFKKITFLPKQTSLLSWFVVRAVADSIRAEPHFTQPLPMNQPINYSFTSHVFIGGFLPTLDLGQEVKKEMGKVLMMNFSFWLSNGE